MNVATVARTRAHTTIEPLVSHLTPELIRVCFNVSSVANVLRYKAAFQDFVLVTVSVTARRFVRVTVYKVVLVVVTSFCQAFIVCRSVLQPN